MLFSPKTVLSGALVSTVSTQSNSVDGQTCGLAVTNKTIFKSKNGYTMYAFIRLKHVVVVDFFAFTMQILLCSKQRKGICFFRHRHMLMPNLENCVLISGQTCGQNEKIGMFECFFRK